METWAIKWGNVSVRGSPMETSPVEWFQTSWLLPVSLLPQEFILSLPFHPWQALAQALPGRVRAWSCCRGSQEAALKGFIFTCLG